MEESDVKDKMSFDSPSIRLWADGFLTQLESFRDAFERDAKTTTQKSLVASFDEFVSDAVEVLTGRAFEREHRGGQSATEALKAYLRTAQDNRPRVAFQLGVSHEGPAQAREQQCPEEVVTLHRGHER
jgi:hypothetical protein